MIKIKLVSSLVNAFLDEKIEKFDSLNRISALRGERLSLQLLHIDEGDDATLRSPARRVVLSGELSKYATVRNVTHVGVSRATNYDYFDDNYLRLEPGLYPDVLTPLHYGGAAITPKDRLNSLWIEINIPKDMTAGEYTVSVRLEGVDAVAECTVEVIAADMPADDIYYTEWFHCDSLAHYYGVKVWSAKHWEIVENFARVAVKNGINMLLTPTFTPPLDTAVGGERLTTQLVGVTKAQGEYSFDFKLLDKWIRMCNRVGVKYFEIAHFFTQWGAGHAPKVMATVDGEYKKIFGWETDATDPEYVKFLRAFVTAFLNHMKLRGDDKRCFFHISDEPHIEHLESYRAAKSAVSDLLSDYTIMDALSSYEFHATGTADMAIPGSNHIKPFLENRVENLWTYYCCSQTKGTSNRLIAMPAYRNRSIGMQMYKYDIKGFLQWGYNFYQNFHSVNPINPYLQNDGDDWVPAGDAFSVYPERDGTALESMRIIVFYEALQDMRAMKLAERLTSREYVIEKIEDAFGKSIEFDVCAHSVSEMLDVRETVNKIIKTHTKRK